MALDPHHFEKKAILSGVLSQILGFQVLEVCLAHALITEREEVMGTLDQPTGWTWHGAGQKFLGRSFSARPTLRHQARQISCFTIKNDHGYVGVPSGELT